jgi:hypothetical protein
VNSLLSQQLESEVIFSDHTYLPGYSAKKRKNPEYFQGNKKKKNYFEGWYFKMVSGDDSSIMSVIPGVSLSENGEKQHAFIQIIDGKTATTSYFTYPIEDFAFSKKKFAIRIGKNYFSEDSLSLNIQNDTISITGTVFMSNTVKLSRKNKGRKKLAIMGWYRFAPFMQCYHGVVSLNHTLNGSIKIDAKSFNFDNGIGYIEKDWGKSMPSSWIWMQSNSFASENSSFMLSIATIPWMGKSFTGFLGFFLHDGKAQRFGTYSHAKLEIETSNSETIKITISDKKYTYQLETYRNKSGMLKAPVKGSMDRRIAESIDAKLKMTVLDKDGIVIFTDSTSIAGLEIVGDMEELSRSIKGGKKKKKN